MPSERRHYLYATQPRYGADMRGEVWVTIVVPRSVFEWVRYERDYLEQQKAGKGGWLNWLRKT